MVVFIVFLFFLVFKEFIYCKVFYRKNLIMYLVSYIVLEVEIILLMYLYILYFVYDSNFIIYYMKLYIKIW